ncbi:MAG: polynucleotide adenylyltransferase PcnB [Acidobacteria bacterium]|nr:MAG: polynucleotide adenylyltransferase PcnB [Acidobacteriota bacterium]
MTVTTSSGPRILARPEHPISRQNIESNALKVLYRLHNANFKGYLVGGAVRDLMLERRPKDFDVSTDARPQQIRRLFRNSRIIGRRFRLAHVYFREGIVEVSTFRRNPDPEAQDGAPGDRLITDDNVFGTPEEDAFRRDFTVNALFYDIGDYSVIDYVGGIEDLEQRLIRAIGDPEIRFKEDPVRMLRACEIAGRLGFDIEEKTAAAARSCRREIERASPARMAEEISQLLRSGSATPALSHARDLGFLGVFLPEAKPLLADDGSEPTDFVEVLPAIDRLVMDNLQPSDAALLAALLLPGVFLRRRDMEQDRGRPIGREALRKLVGRVVDPFLLRFRISKAKSDQTHQAIAAFHRLGDNWRTAGDRVRFAGHPGFDDALTLLEILVAATGEGGEDLELWQRVREHRPKRRKPPTRRTRPRRRRRRR